MPSCVVPCCKNREGKSSNVSFYRFPVDDSIRRKWISRIRRTNYNYSFHDRICSWHFPNGKSNGPTRFAWNERNLMPIQANTNVKKKTAATIRVPHLSVSTQIKNKRSRSRKQLIQPKQDFSDDSSSNLYKVPKKQTKAGQILDLKMQLNLSTEKNKKLESETRNLLRENLRLKIENESVRENIQKLESNSVELNETIRSQSILIPDLIINNERLKAGKNTPFCNHKVFVNEN